MKAIAEVQVIPLGTGVSVRQEVQRAHGILKEAGLETQLHAYGTNVEGDLDTLFKAIKAIHETLHAEGTVRLVTVLKIGTRTDKETSLAGKLF